MTAKSVTECADASALEWCYRAFLANKAENTRRAYQVDLSAFARWRSENDSLIAIRKFILQGFPEALDEGSRYSKWLFQNCASRRTALRRLASFKSLVAQLYRDGVIAWSLPIAPPLPTAVDRQRYREYESRRPSSDTIARLAAELESSGGAASLRDRLIVYFVSVLLLRNIELIHLLVEDIDWQKNELLVRGSSEPDRRGGRPKVRERRVPIPTAMGPELKHWVDTVLPIGAEHLFVRVRGKRCVTAEGLTVRGIHCIVSGWCARLGIRRLNSRRLRESGIRSMLEQAREFDVSPADVADIAGIANVARFRRHWRRGNLEGQRTAVEAALGAISST